MKRKLLLGILTITASLCCAFGFAGCGEHEHNYGILASDKNYHWHECTNDGCDMKIKDKAEHIDNNDDGRCDICGQTVHRHSLCFNEEKPSTCDNDGIKAYYSCLTCGKWFTDKEGKSEITDKSETVLPKGHKLTPVEEKKATCTANGYATHYECSGCDKWFSDKDGKNEITDKSKAIYIKTEHSFEKQICAVCGYHEATAGLQYADKGDYCELTGIGTATATNIFIADEYNGKPVTAIGESAFENITAIKSVTVPYSVTSVGIRAFYKCTALTRVEMNENITAIGYQAFDSCINLTDFKIPESVTSVDGYAFYRCQSLKSINIPENLTKIDWHAFSGCSGLTKITVSEKNSRYFSSGNCLIDTQYKLLFLGCANSVIPDDGSVTAIHDQAFFNCTNLTKLTIPVSVTKIEDNAFNGCLNLTSIIFKGTKAQWDKIEKGESWDNNTAKYTISFTN